MLEYRYRAFISYSHRDSAWADWLQRALESYSIPPRLVGLTTSAGPIPSRLAPIFRDRDELPSATDLSRKVGEVLAQSACLIVVCSPHAAQSHWVDEEVKAFQRLGRADRIYCLIVDGEPGASTWPGREHDECLAPSLKQHFDEAGNATGAPFEPIAADARPGKDGKSNARIKLIAGILGVDLDDLKHRERRRRRWRATALMAASFALLALTTTLAVNAVIARHAAERRQKQAEDLVGFMLGDLDDKLREVNRLDILESVADKAVKYFEALPVADVTDDTLEQRTRALLKLGAVRRDQGRVAEALDAFNLALASSEQLVRHAPSNTDFQKTYAESLTWLGFIDWSQGRLDEASDRFVAARDTLERARAEKPGDSELLDPLAIAHSNMGRVLEARNQLADARREYLAVVQVYELLTRMQPDKLNWKAELGYAHGNLGLLARKEGRFEEAVGEYATDLKLKMGLATIDPTNNNRREDLAAANAALGDTLVTCGALAEAERYLRTALDGAEGLVAIDPSATDWLEKAGDYSWKLGHIERARHNIAAAAAADESAVSRLRSLAAKDASMVIWQRRLAQAHIEYGRLQLERMRLESARDSGESAWAAISHTIQNDRNDRVSLLIAAQTKLLLGDIAAAMHDSSAAALAWRNAEELSKQDINGARQPEALDVFVSALLRQEKIDDVQADAQWLWKVGYFAPDFVRNIRDANVPYPENEEARGRIEAALSGHIDSNAMRSTEVQTDVSSQ